MSELGDGIQKLEVDVTNDASCEQGVKFIYAATGRVDIFVSNAGVASVGKQLTVFNQPPSNSLLSHSGPLLDIPLEMAQKVMDTNLFGTLRLVQLIGPRMAKRGKGLIIPVGSTAGELSLPFMGHYNASKAALHAFTETLAEECRLINVNVMLCVPGSIVSNIANVSVFSASLRTRSNIISHRMRLNITKAICKKIRFTTDIKHK